MGFFMFKKRKNVGYEHNDQQQERTGFFKSKAESMEHTDKPLFNEKPDDEKAMDEHVENQEKMIQEKAKQYGQ